MLEIELPGRKKTYRRTMDVVNQDMRMVGVTLVEPVTKTGKLLKVHFFKIVLCCLKLILD